MTSNFIVRKAAPTEASLIVDFQIAMAWESEKMKLDQAVVTRGVQSVFENKQHGIYFVAEPSNQPGTIAASLLITFEWSDWRNGQVWWIHSVYVRPEFRKQGAYKTMYEHLQNVVRADPNLRGLRLYVDKTNTNAQKVYVNLGMDLEHYHLGEWLK